MNRPHPLSKLRKSKMNSTKTKSSRSSRFQSLTPRILLSLSYDTLTAHLLLRPSLANLAHEMCAVKRASSLLRSSNTNSRTEEDALLSLLLHLRDTNIFVRNA